MRISVPRVLALLFCIYIHGQFQNDLTEVSKVMQIKAITMMEPIFVILEKCKQCNWIFCVVQYHKLQVLFTANLYSLSKKTLERHIIFEFLFYILEILVKQMIKLIATSLLIWILEQNTESD